MDPVKHPLWTLVDTIASRDEDIRAAQLVEHRAILDAIIDRDPDRAERAMAMHMEALSQRIFGATANPIRRAGLRTPSRRTPSRRP
jgi:DNA-binding FadR family transcriptional regulator